MLAHFVAELLSGTLGQYVKIDERQISVGIWSGQLELHELQLVPEAVQVLFERACGSAPFHVRSGYIGRVCVEVPWKTLSWSQPLRIQIEDVCVQLAALPPDSSSTEAATRSQRMQFAELATDASLREAQLRAWLMVLREAASEAENEIAARIASAARALAVDPKSNNTNISGWRKRLLRQVVANMQVQVGNIWVIFGMDASESGSCTSRGVQRSATGDADNRCTNGSGASAAAASEDPARSRLGTVLESREVDAGTRGVNAPAPESKQSNAAAETDAPFSVQCNECAPEITHEASEDSFTNVLDIEAKAGSTPIGGQRSENIHVDRTDGKSVRGAARRPDQRSDELLELASALLDVEYSPDATTRAVTPEAHSSSTEQGRCDALHPVARNLSYAVPPEPDARPDDFLDAFSAVAQDARTTPASCRAAAGAQAVHPHQSQEHIIALHLYLKAFEIAPIVDASGAPDTSTVDSDVLAKRVAFSGLMLLAACGLNELNRPLLSHEPPTSSQLSDVWGLFEQVRTQSQSAEASAMLSLVLAPLEITMHLRLTGGLLSLTNSDPRSVSQLNIHISAVKWHLERELLEQLSQVIHRWTRCAPLNRSRGASSPRTRWYDTLEAIRPGFWLRQRSSKMRRPEIVRRRRKEREQYVTTRYQSLLNRLLSPSDPLWAHIERKETNPELLTHALASHWRVALAHQ
jgi:hypothetical protein